MEQNASLITMICFSLYAIVCCTLALLMQHYLFNLVEVEKQRAVLAQIRQEEQKQYQISRGASEQLHIIYHDLKHKLSMLQQRLPGEEVDAMKDALDSYSATYQTGLDALDVVLDEKRMFAMGKGITLTFMGNGEDLAFMSQMEIYSMFSNLLENAIAAVDQISTPEKKVISLVVERKGQLVSLNVINYMEETELTYTDSLPNSTKKEEPGFHGYGLRSVRAIAKKYGGEITVSTMEDIFMINIYMMPEPAEV